MSRRKVKFLKTLRQASGSIERIIPQDVPRNARTNYSYRRAVSLVPEDHKLTLWVTWAASTGKGQR